jgi:type IV pilus assembly protein PilM
MAFAFLKGSSRKSPDQVVAVDLGNRTTKAVHLQRKGQTYSLAAYTLLDAPIFEKAMSAELLKEHLKQVITALGAKTRSVTLTLGVSDALVRILEMPVMPAEDLRMVLKHNSRAYLQQDMSNYVFDCYVPGKAATASKGQNSTQKQKVMVAGARKQLIDDFVEGARAAALVVDRIVPGLIGPVNAFERSAPDLFASGVAAIVDIGYKNTAICIVENGELLLSRVVAIGGDKFTADLSEALKVSYAEAEGIKIGMPAEVQSHLEMTLTPLGRELRASIDFFEHQHDKTLKHVFLTGGSACSDFMVQRLQQELMVECQVLNPVNFLQVDLQPQQAAEVAQIAPQLSVALGAALSAF